MYDDDPLGQIGQLHDAMFRGVRLVVDSGMHAHEMEPRAGGEVLRRHAGRPGSLGDHRDRTLLRVAGPGLQLHAGQADLPDAQRDKAKTALGAKFDIRKFHDAVLLGGAVPLTVLETIIDGYIAARLAKA